MVMDQLDQLLEDIDKNDVPFLVCTILYFNFNLGLFSRQQFLMMFFLFFPENSIWDNLHEMSKPVFREKSKKIFEYVICWKFYPEC